MGVWGPFSYLVSHIHSGLGRGCVGIKQCCIYSSFRLLYHLFLILNMAFHSLCAIHNSEAAACRVALNWKAGPRAVGTERLKKTACHCSRAMATPPTLLPQPRSCSIQHRVGRGILGTHQGSPIEKSWALHSDSLKRFASLREISTQGHCAVQNSLNHSVWRHNTDIFLLKFTFRWHLSKLKYKDHLQGPV